MDDDTEDGKLKDLKAILEKREMNIKLLYQELHEKAVAMYVNDDGKGMLRFGRCIERWDNNDSRGMLCGGGLQFQGGAAYTGETV